MEEVTDEKLSSPKATDAKLSIPDKLSIPNKIESNPPIAPPAVVPASRIWDQPSVPRSSVAGPPQQLATVDGIVLIPQPTSDPRDPLVCGFFFHTFILAT